MQQVCRQGGGAARLGQLEGEGMMEHPVQEREYLPVLKICVFTASAAKERTHSKPRSYAIVVHVDQVDRVNEGFERGRQSLVAGGAWCCTSLGALSGCDLEYSP